jgi:XRE family transcriptional regulator, fatty acid utilization regulator
VAALTGQPYVTELQQDRLAELIRPIRDGLELYDLGADPDITPRPAPQLTAAEHAALNLPEVIAEITTAAPNSAGGPEAGGRPGIPSGVRQESR